jgi:hypothetical protein
MWREARGRPRQATHGKTARIGKGRDDTLSPSSNGHTTVRDGPKRLTVESVGSIPTLST